MRTTDIDRERAMIERVTELYRHTVHFKTPMADVSTAWLTLLSHADYKRLPMYRRHAVRAIFYHLFHGPADMSIYQHLEYRLLYKGQYYKGFDTWRAQFPSADASEIETGGHFWIGTERKY